VRRFLSNYFDLFVIIIKDYFYASTALTLWVGHREGNLSIKIPFQQSPVVSLTNHDLIQSVEFQNCR